MYTTNNSYPHVIESLLACSVGFNDTCPDSVRLRAVSRRRRKNYNGTVAMLIAPYRTLLGIKVDGKVSQGILLVIMGCLSWVNTCVEIGLTSDVALFPL